MKKTGILIGLLLILGGGLIAAKGRGGQVSPKWTVDIITLNYQGNGIHGFETFLNCPNSPEIKDNGAFILYLENGFTQSGTLLPGHQRLRWKQNP